MFELSVAFRRSLCALFWPEVDQKEVDQKRPLDVALFFILAAYVPSSVGEVCCRERWGHILPLAFASIFVKRPANKFLLLRHAQVQGFGHLA